MTAADPFAHDDAAYVLGALEDDERRAFEAHLETCADCRARVADLRSTADLLALVPAGTTDLDRDVTDLDATDVIDAGPVPDTLLPGLLRRARRERARHRAFAGAVAAVAVACAIALAVVVWPGGSSTPPPARPLAAVQPSPLSVTARLTAQDWGTRIDLHCTYRALGSDYPVYRLVVIDRQQGVHAAGDWSLVPGRTELNFTGGTNVPANQIARVQVTTTSGKPLLQLKL